MKKACLRFIFLLILINNIGSGKIFSQNTLPFDSIITENFAKQLSYYPQEKIYAQIDKPFYITGEDIWFRAFLTNALSQLPDTSSRYVYAELINPMDSVISRVKVRPVKGAYQGHINLDEALPEGEYQLRFYTRFMESQGDNYFFKRQVRIGDPLAALYRTEPTFEYEDKNKINISLQIIDINDNSPIKPDKIEIMNERGELRQEKMNDQYTVNISRKISHTRKNNILYIEYEYGGKFHKQYIPIPNQSDYEVTFLPEGGHNVAGVMNKMAFKALNADGVGEDIEGIVVAQRGDTLGYFQSSHRGMGLFLYRMYQDSISYAVCKNKDGLVKKYELPVTTANNISLRVDGLNSRVTVSLNIPYNEPLDKPFYLLIHCKGQVLKAFEWNNEKSFVFLSKKELPTGVIQFLLFDEEMNPVSERLFFNINENSIAKISFDTDKLNYGKRELIKGSFEVTDREDNPLIATLSVAVTDDRDIKPDTCVNILSTMLLTSELKGHIESPAYYFSGNKSEKQSNLDLLMMTQGWSRYDIKKIIKGDFETPKSYLELSQFISGTAKGGFFMNRQSEGMPIMLISAESGIFDQTFTDKEGKFFFQGFESADSTSFIIQALTKKGGSRVELTLDPEVFPKSKFSLPFSFTENRSLFENYLEKADRNFILANGMRMIYLKDIEVTADRSRSDTRKSRFSSPMNTIITHKEFEKYNPQDIYQVLMRIGGVTVTGQKVSIRGGGEPLILIDDIQYESDMLPIISMQDIDEIEVVKDGTAAIFGVRGGNGVIMITTKRGEINYKTIPPFNIKKITPLGYQVTKAFYSPQYATREVKSNPNPDLRTTIYWNPSVWTDADGEADISFYSSDASTTYSVVIEGIANDGKLIHAVHKISRED